ncbi:MAG: pilus assembly protein [Pirellulales bacterium]|nr:pilus assembly protein [Pirellulales bacterium]
MLDSPPVPCRNRRKFRRAGVQTLELVLVTPVIVIVFVAAFQFGLVHWTQSAITHAATEGAREAGKDAPHQTPANLVVEIAGVVDAVLDPMGIDISNASGSGTRVTLEVGGNTASFGDPTFNCNPPASPTLSSDEVRVTVCIKLDKTPVLDPGALGYFGFVFPGDHFRVSTVSLIE